ncbi:Putative exporter of the RND superfamily [Halorhabdus sp. BNX81]|nr:Putative exporter of the RND superfamily [Halorhabdus sp. BNX81]
MAVTSVVDHERVVDGIGRVIVDRPGRVVLAFLVVTAGFAFGIPGVGIDSGTQRFFESVPEHHTQAFVDNQFGSTFEAGEDSTQVVLTSENVFSKPSLLRLLELQAELEADPSLRVRAVTGIASGTASVLDPFATTTAAQRRTIETATPAEVRDAARTLLDRRPGITQLLSEDLNPNQPRASATMVLVSHAVPEGDDSTLEAVQQRVQVTAETGDGDVRVFGSAIQQAGFDRAIFESLSLIVPVVIVLILAFLTVAYRDPIDLVLALISLLMAIVWTFGFMGLVGIPFNLMMIAVPVLLLGVGIDFGIHAVNRYREERVDGRSVDESMATATRGLLVAFFIVAVTNVIGFSANVTSALAPVREFGLVVAIGMVFTLAVFGVFLPALKVRTDHWRAAHGIGQFSMTPLGGEGSRLGTALRSSAVMAKRHPVVLVAIILLVTAGAAHSATNVQSKFETDDFLPYAEHPPQIDVLPDEIAPSEFEITATSNYITDTFETTNTEQVTLYLEGPLQRNHALEAIYRTGTDPPDSFVREDGRAVSEGIIDVIRSHAENDEGFAARLQRNDLTENDVPDRNLEPIYDELLASESGEQAREYLTEDRQATKVVYQVKASASQKEVTEDARELAANARHDAVATGDIVVFRALTEALMESAVSSFLVAFGLSAVFLIVIFWLLEDRPSLGVVTMVPITVAIVLLVGTMPVLGIAFNALTATILSISIGLGIDYSVHVVHRFVDEYDECGDVQEALLVTLGGTGGGITASVLTTSGSTLCMTIAVNPILGEFGLLTGISTFLSYITAIAVLPLTLRGWVWLFE